MKRAVILALMMILAVAFVGCDNGDTGPQGPQGPPGIEGPQGPSGSPGLPGDNGNWIFTGRGEPGIIEGSNIGDLYINLKNLSIWEFTENGWINVSRDKDKKEKGDHNNDDHLDNGKDK